jgi:DNA polymerase-1
MPLPERPDLVLIDGSSYLYRAFFALPPLTNSKGVPTGAIYGVLNMLSKFVRDFAPPHIGVVFDAPGKTFRDDLFAEYKAHRAPMPDDLRSQTEPLLAAVEALGLPVLRIAGVEADDVIGTLACRAAARGQSVLISTGDKDMAQLVNEHITLINTMSNSVLDRAGVKAKFDVFPEQMIDYLALVGDSSDNIPGIDKVGPKTAAKWLNAYGTLDGLLAHVSEIPGKVGENLRAGLTTLELSRQLATIRTDLTLELDESGLTRRAADYAKLRAIYGALELRSLLQQLEAVAAAEAANAPPGTVTVAVAAEVVVVTPADPRAAELAAIPRRYETITDYDTLARWCEALAAAELFAFDTETTSLDYMNTEIVGVSFCIEPGHAAYVPLAHDYAGAPEQLDRTRVLEMLRPLLEDPGRGKLGSRTTASRCAASATTPCSSRTFSTAPPRVMTWTRWRSTTSAWAPFISRTWPARAPSRSASIRSVSRPPPSTRPRTPTSPCACTRCCGRDCRRHRRWRACTGKWSSRWCRYCSAWNARAC